MTLCADGQFDPEEYAAFLEARARGDEFRRYTYGDVEDPPLILSELRALLPVERPA